MTLNRQTLMVIAAAGSLGLLVAAFGFQYLGGLAPCQMCVWQRYPHAIAIAIGAIALRVPATTLAWLGAAAAVTTAGIAGFHAGVEYGFWEGPTSCASQPIGGLSTDELFDQIMTAPVVRCDEIAWSLMGLSMASWNMLASLALAAIWIWAARKPT